MRSPLNARRAAPRARCGRSRRIRPGSFRPCRRRRHRRGWRRTSARHGSRRRSRRLRRGRPGVQRKLGDGDQVLVVAIDERRRWDAVDHGDAAARQREAVRGEIDDVGADRRPAGEPGFHRVPVGRRDVERLAGHRGAGEIRYEPVRDGPRRVRRLQRHETDAGGESEHGERCGERQALPQGRKAATERNDRRPGRRGGVGERQHAVGERLRRGLARGVATHRVPHRLEFAKLRGEGRIGGEVAFEREPVRGVEFAVQSGVQPQASRIWGGSLMARPSWILRARCGRARGAT